MLECCGSVSLDKKMANPRGAITWNQSKWKEPPSAGNNEEHGAGNPDRSADQVKQTGRGLTVFRHVMGPEFRE